MGPSYYSMNGQENAMYGCFFNAPVQPWLEHPNDNVNPNYPGKSTFYCCGEGGPDFCVAEPGRDGDLWCPATDGPDNADGVNYQNDCWTLMVIRYGDDVGAEGKVCMNLFGGLSRCAYVSAEVGCRCCRDLE